MPWFDSWVVDTSEHFVVKARQNLRCATMARDKELFDPEASRIYYALHQLALELVRAGKFSPEPSELRNPQDRFSLKHRSYGHYLMRLLDMPQASRILGRWFVLRVKADYEPQSLADDVQWQQTIDERRKEAVELSNAIYEYLHKNS